MDEVGIRIVADTSDLKRGVDEILATGVRLESSYKDVSTSITSSFNQAANSAENFDKAVKKVDSDVDILTRSLERAGDSYDDLTGDIRQTERQLEQLIAAEQKGEAIDKRAIELTAEKLKGLRQTKSAIDSLAQSYTNTSAKADKFETISSRISSGMNRLSENLMMMFGVQMGAEFAMEGVRAYAAQAESQQRLLVALGNRADVQQRLIKQADELKEAYLFDDDVINQAQAFLAAQGRSEAQINKVTKAAAGMSRALGIDYQTAIEMLDSTLEGNRGRLGKYAGEVKKLTDAQLKNGEAVDVFLEKYDKVGLAFSETKAGQIQKVTMSFEDLKKKLGEMVVSIPLLDTAVAGLGDYWKMLGNILTVFNKDATAAGDAIGSFTQVITPLPAISKYLLGFDLAGWFRGLFSPVASATEAIFGAESALTKFVKGLTNYEEQIKPMTKGVEGVAMAFTKLTVSIDAADEAQVRYFKTMAEINAQQTVLATRMKDVIARFQQAFPEASVETLVKLMNQFHQAEKEELMTGKEIIDKNDKAYKTWLGIKDAIGGATKAVKEHTESLGPYQEWVQELAKSEQNLKNLLAARDEGVTGLGGMIDAQVDRITEFSAKIEKADDDYKKLTETIVDSTGEVIPALEAIGDVSFDQSLIPKKWHEELLGLEGAFRNFGESLGDFAKKESTKQYASAIKTTLGQFSDVASKFIDLKQEETRVLQAENQKQIDAVNERIKAEEDAQKAGIANSLKAEKEKLAMLNFEKAKYIAEQNRLAKQERAVAQIESTASLISGVSAAIGSSGGNPIIAAIQIAGLLAVFAASMAKAKAAAKSFGKGGILSGKSHDQGGIYIPELNSEVEGGEYVINKRSTRKHKLFLDAINKDAKWLANINLNGQKDVNVSVNFEDSKNLAETNTILRRNGQKASWVDGQYYCKKDGIVITRVKR